MNGKQLKEVIDKLGITQRKLAEEMRVTPQTISAILTAKDVRTSTIERVAEVTKMPISYFFKENDVEQDAVVLDDGIPLLDGEQVRAGALSGFGQPLEPVDTIRLPELRGWRDGDFAVRANGRSMIDPTRPEQSIPDGAIVVLRPWLDRNIHWGEMYCIYTQEGYAIKRIMKGDDEQHIKCVSNNEAEGYEPYQVERDSILGIARVTAIISVKTLWA